MLGVVAADLYFVRRRGCDEELARLAAKRDQSAHQTMDELHEALMAQAAALDKLRAEKSRVRSLRRQLDAREVEVLLKGGMRHGRHGEGRHVAAVPAAANQVARVLVIIITREAVHTHNVHGALAAVVGRDPKLAAVS